MTLLSSLVCVGQLLFSVGVQTKTYWVMHVGRIIFGVGGESLSVAQTRMTTKWFKGKELAFALGVNLSVARLGSVLNDFLSPLLGLRVSIPFAIWFGFVTCIVSLLSGLLLNYVDERGGLFVGQSAAATSTRYHMAPSHSVSLSTLGASSQDDDDGDDPAPSRSPRRSMAIAREPAPVGAAAVAFGPGGRTRGLEDVTGAGAGGGAGEQGGRAHGHGAAGTLDLKAVVEFPYAFWLICIIMCLMYATVIPFNTIHSAFLQARWYQNDPTT
ncbi:hypothetical protein HK405_000618, partial [Cladochytrium tenue]